MNLHAPQCSCGEEFDDREDLETHLDIHQIVPHDRHSVRKPTEDEIEALVAYYQEKDYDPNQVSNAVNAQYMVVIEGYITGGPGYAGRLLLTVAEATPGYYNVFLWVDGEWKPRVQAEEMQEMHGSSGGDA